jgi:hypothetical protein
MSFTARSVGAGAGESRPSRAVCAPQRGVSHAPFGGAGGSGHVLDDYYCDVVIVGAITDQGFEQEVDVLARREVG